MSAEPGTRSLLDRLKVLFGRASPRAEVPQHGGARFQLLYERFREILALNDATLQLIADMEEMRARRAADALDALAPRIRRVAMDVFLMAKNLNQIAGGKYPELYQVLKTINEQIEAELANRDTSAAGPPVVRLDAVRLADAPLAGAKMATLGELRASGRCSVPDGFVVTTSAFAQFMNEAELWDRAERLESLLATKGPESLPEACQEVREAILRAPVPAAVA